MATNKLISPNRITPSVFLLLTLLAAGVGLVGCPGKDGNAGNGQTSAVQTEPETQSDAVDWSTVTPENLWAGVSELYASDGPEMALTLVERGLDNGVVTELEAGQIRAGFLYELGRLDEAFLALYQYQIDASRPDLLNLRADILWGMGRYSEALRDYEALLESMGDEPEFEVLYALARLYDDMGEWDRAGEMRDRINAEPDNPVALQLGLVDAISSEDVDRIRQAGDKAIDVYSTQGFEKNPISTFGAAYGAYLEDDYDTAESILEEYIASNGENLNVASLLLSMDVEKNEFMAFESRLRESLEKEHALEWLDAPESVFPRLPSKPLFVAGLLDFAGALELGRGSRGRAEILAERSLSLNPYDHVAMLQGAAIAMTRDDIPAAYEKLNEALAVVSPADVRTRLRILQFSRMIGETEEPLWDEESVMDQLTGTLEHLTAVYPQNAYYTAASAEVSGYSGDIGTAVGGYDRACVMSGVTREMQYRRAYWIARNGDPEGAFDVFKEAVPEGSPYLTWAAALSIEARIQSDENLARFAVLVLEHLKPGVRDLQFIDDEE